MPGYLNSFYIITLTIAVTLLAGCGVGSGTGGYQSDPWRYQGASQSNAQQPPAETSPKTLSQNVVPGRPASQAATQTSQIQELPTVKIGLLLPLTGKNSSLGQSMLQAAQMALFDVGHANLELIPADTKGTEAGAAQAARSLLNQDAQIFLGPVFAENVRSVQNVIQGTSVNMIAFSTDWNLANYNTFVMGFLPFDQVERIIEFAARQNYRNMAVLSPDNAYGQNILELYKSISGRYGLRTVEVQTFSPHATNLSPLLRSFTRYDERMIEQERLAQKQQEFPATGDIYGSNEKISPPPFDAIFMPVSGDLAVSVSDSLVEYGLPPEQVKRLGIGLWDENRLSREESLDSAWFSAPSPALHRNFESRYMTMYAVQPPRLSSLAYDATALAAVLARRGLQENGVPAFDRTSITNPNGFAGIDGIFRFRENGLVERGLAVLTFDRGRIKILEDAPKTFETYRKF